MAENDSDNTFRILISTDNHIGYMDQDGTRCNDSINTFEEILQIAQREEVDFMLLGGDLFHDNKPSRRSIVNTMELLRRYCHGDRPCAVEFLSDQSVNFGHTGFPNVNYEDPCINIAVPVFSIHGNHDDPAGNGNYCTLDMLHAAGLVNYFGKITSLDSICMSPLLMKKGSTKLSLYGLGSVRDERLHRMFCHKSVKMLRPIEHRDDWFNLFVTHQNRSKHGATNYIPEQFLDDFLDLVFWGHEHECRIDPEWNSLQNFYVTQPGSSIATSLSEGETKTKYVGLLLINGKNFKIKKIPLETVRQFYMEDIVLSDTDIRPGEPDTVKRMETYCMEKMEQLLDTAARERVGKPKMPDKPLIRIRVEYTDDYELFSAHRFGQKYVDRVANPKDIIHFHRQKVQPTAKQNNGEKFDFGPISVNAESLDTRRIEDMVKEFFLKADKNKQLTLLTERGMSDAIKEFVDKEERAAIEELVRYQLQKTQEYLLKQNSSDDTLDADVLRFKEERRKNVKEEDEEVEEAMSRARSKRPQNEELDTRMGDEEMTDNDDETEVIPTTSTAATRGRGSRRARGTTAARGRGSRGGRGRGSAPQGSQSIADAFMTSTARGKKKSSKAVISSDDDDEVSIIENNDSDDNNPFDLIPASNRRGKNKLEVTRTSAKALASPAGSSSSGGTRSGRRAKAGVSYDDDDDDEFDRLVPARRRK